MKPADLRKIAARASKQASRIAKRGRLGAAEPQPAPGPVPPAPKAADGEKTRQRPALRVVGEGAKPPKLRIPESVVLAARSRRRVAPEGTTPAQQAFGIIRPNQPAPGVLPAGRKLAMDSSLLPSGVLDWAGGWFVQAGWFEGVSFPGYPILAELAQRTEYRKASERLSTEVTKKWIKLNSTGDEDKTERIQKIDEFLRDIKLRDAAQKAVFMDGTMGRSHWYLDTGDTDDPAELKKPIGDGRNKISTGKIGSNKPLLRISVIDPTWTYPASYNASNPLKPDWLKPETWFVMGTEIHRSRLLSFVGREVPDLFKPSFMFGGLSLTQMMRTYVDNWVSVRQHVARVISNFSKNGLKTDLQQQLSPGDGSGDATGGGDFMRRIDLYAALSDNNGLMVLNKDSEEFFQFNTPLGTLDALQAQALEQICLPGGMPVVVFLGLTPKGLNASSEGEMLAWESWVQAYQPHFFGDNIQRVIDFAQLSLFGDVDPTIGYEWVPLRSLSEKETGEIQKTKADTDAVYVDRGVLDPLEVRTRLASDPQSGYNGIDPEDVPEPPDDGGEGGGEQPDEDPFAAGDPENTEDTAEDDFSDLEEAAEDGTVPFARDAEWKEGDHPRGEAGRFSPVGGSPLKPGDLTKVGKQMGSNPGGVFEHKDTGERFYVKKGQSPDHVKNELLAARLYGRAGAPTLQYRPVEGGGHIATAMQNLDKKRVQDFSPEEVKKAQEDFASHAWLANWDAVGLEGDNQGTVNGVPTSLDLGGALNYRAQGAPKGAAFGNKVGELDTLRDPKMNPVSARTFGKMTPGQLKASAAKVTSIPDAEIRAIVKEGGGDDALAAKLIARKRDIASRFGLAADARSCIHLGDDVWAWDEAKFEESKHPRVKGGEHAGEFASKGGASGSATAEAPKSKKALIASLLTKGVSAQEVLKATGWPSVSMPQQAHAAGMKLTKYNEGGVTKYKGVPYTPEEKAAAEAAIKAKKESKKQGLVTTAPSSKQELAGGGKVETGLKKLAGHSNLSWGTISELTAEEHAALVDKYGTIAGAFNAAHKQNAAPAAAPAEPVKPAAPTHVTATPEQIAKAKSKYPLKQNILPYVDQKKLDAFNNNWAGEQAPKTDGQALAKIAAFNELKSENDAAAAKQAEVAKAAAVAQKQKEAEAAKLAAAKNASYMKELGIGEQEALGFTALVKMMGGSEKDFVAKFKGYEDTAKGYGYPISGFQAALIMNYTDGGYSGINTALRSGTWTVAQHVYARMVNKALMKMPRYEGVVKRGTQLPTSEQQKYIVGNVVVEHAFTSTAASGEGFKGGNTKFEIKAIGQRAAHVKKLSNHASEDEVLFAARTCFKVTKVEGAPGGSMKVYMEEMPDD